MAHDIQRCAKRGIDETVVAEPQLEERTTRGVRH
jgi:hypothetical protein